MSSATCCAGCSKTSPSSPEASHALMVTCSGETKELAEASPLPEEVWIMVFENLPFADLMQVRTVNKEWRNIIDKCLTLSRKIALNFPNNLSLDRNFKPDSLPAVSKISFTFTRIVAIESWWSSFEKSLTSLEINAQMMFPVLLGMLREVPNLSYLKLSHGEILTVNASTNEIANFRLEKMKSLEINSVAHDEVLVIFTKIFPQLENFSLESYEGYDGVLTMVKQLQDTLEGIDLCCSSRLFFDVVKAKPFKRLKVNIKDCVQNEHLATFCQAQPLLERLSLNMELSSVDEPTFTKNLTNLKHLKLRIRNESCKVNLKNLKITDSNKLEFFEYDGGFTNKISLAGIKHPELKELILSSKVDALQEYFENAPNLRDILIKSCRLSTWSDLFVPIHLKSLHTLDIYRVYVSYYSDYDGLIANFEELRNLRIAYGGIEKQQLITLFRLCPKLEKLELSNILGVDDDVVLTLCQEMKQLRVLTLAWCPEITDMAAEHIIKYYAQKLETLNIYCCPKLSSEATAKLKGVGIGSKSILGDKDQSIMDKSMRSVGNIPYGATEEKLEDDFSEVGPVILLKLMLDRENGMPKGYGICEYTPKRDRWVMINHHQHGGYHLP